MKKAFVAVEDENEITGKVKAELEQLAEKNHYEIQGLLQYPRGTILENSELFIETMKSIGADCIFVTSPEFIIQEIQSDGKLSKTAKEHNLKIIDTTLEIDIAEMKNIMPENIIDEISTMMKLKDELDQARSNMLAHANHHSAMIITKEADSSEVEQFTDHISDSGYRNFTVVQMQDYMPEVEDMLESVIKKYNVDKIFILDEYGSPKLDRFLNRMEDKGIEVSCDAKEEMTMSVKSCFTGMFMS